MNEDKSLDAQLALLGCMMIQPEISGEVLQQVRDEDFSDAALRSVYAAARQVFLSGRATDPVLVRDAAGKEYTRVWNEEIWPTAEAEALKTIADAGCAVNEIDKTPFIEATQSVRDDFAKNGTPEQVELYNLIMEVRG